MLRLTEQVRQIKMVDFIYLVNWLEIGTILDGLGFFVLFNNNLDVDSKLKPCLSCLAHNVGYENILNKINVLTMILLFFKQVTIIFAPL